MELKFGFETLLYFLCIPPTLIAIYFGMGYSAKAQKNWILGVMLPFDELANEEVSSIVGEYKKTLKNSIMIAILLSLPLLFSYKYSTPYIIYLMLHIMGISFFAEYCIYKYNGKLHQLKKKNGWNSLVGYVRTVMVDTKASASPMPLKVKDTYFILPLILFVSSLLPFLLDTDLGYSVLYITLGVAIFTLAVTFILYRAIKYSRNKVYSMDSETNRQINMLYKSLYSGLFYYIAVMQGLMQIMMSLMLAGIVNIIIFLMACILLSFSVVVVILYMIHQRKKINMRYFSQKEDIEIGNELICEDIYWKGGIFYYNKHDKRFLVDAPFGFNITFNLAHKAGKIVMAAVVLLLIWCFALMINISVEEFTIHKGYISETSTGYTVHMESNMYKYSFEISEIDELELMTQMPKVTARINGMGTAELSRGKFSVKGYKESYLMLDKSCDYVVYIKASGKNYFYNEKTPELTNAFYQKIEPLIN